jgi:hypothetical protein
MRIYGAQNVVEENVTRSAVKRTCERNALLLTSGQSNTFLPNESLVSSVENLEIPLKRAGDDDLLIPLRVPV